MKRLDEAVRAGLSDLPPISLWRASACALAVVLAPFVLLALVAGL